MKSVFDYIGLVYSRRRYASGQRFRPHTQRAHSRLGKRPEKEPEERGRFLLHALQNLLGEVVVDLGLIVKRLEVCAPQ